MAQSQSHSHEQSLQPKIAVLCDRLGPATSFFQSRKVPVGAPPIEAPHTSVDAALAAARPMAQGALAGIAWPTPPQAEWKIQFGAADGPPTEVVVSDADALAHPPEPAPPETIARKMRRWHDGTQMGPIWQTLIFLGGIIPALLSVTGIIIWWRARVRRRANGKVAPAIA